MDWFAKAVKRELERKGFRVDEAGYFAFDFLITNPKGKKAAVKCQAHGHIYAPQKKELLNISRRLGLYLVYIASEKYVTDSGVHDVKIELIK